MKACKHTHDEMNENTYKHDDTVHRQWH